MIYNILIKPKVLFPIAAFKVSDNTLRIVDIVSDQGHVLINQIINKIYEGLS